MKLPAIDPCPAVLEAGAGSQGTPDFFSEEVVFYVYVIHTFQKGIIKD